MTGKTGKKDVAQDPVQNAMGNFGIWHLWIALALSLVNFPVAWHQLSIVFLAPPTRFGCSSSVPSNSTVEISLDDQCFTNKTGTEEKCVQFEYDRSVFKDSIITEWDLVCDRKQLANFLQTIIMFGVLVGNIVFGSIADRIGRKTPLVLALLLQSLTGLGSAFAKWYELFVALKFFGAVATGGTMMTSFVLLMEIVGAEWRSLWSVLFHVPFILGHLINPLISYLTKTWYGFQLVVSIPPVLLLSYYWIIPESPRWLLAVGRVDEAEEILTKAAMKNRINFDNVRVAIEAHESQITPLKETDNSTKKYNITHLFRTPNLRIKTICICVNWFTCGICFFGLAHYVGKLNGDIFINVAVSAAMELPGTVLVLYLISRVSRLKILMGGNILSGASLVLLATTTNPTARVCLATMGLVGMSISFPTVYLYSTEVFPTVVRNNGMGLVGLCARIGSMVAPYITDLDSVQSWLPALIFSIGPLVGAVLCLFLPETMNCDLPETIEDGEKFGKKGLRQPISTRDN